MAAMEENETTTTTKKKKNYWYILLNWLPPLPHRHHWTNCLCNGHVLSMLEWPFITTHNINWQNYAHMEVPYLSLAPLPRSRSHSHPSSSAKVFHGVLGRTLLCFMLVYTFKIIALYYWFIWWCLNFGFCINFIGHPGAGTASIHAFACKGQ